MKPKPNRRQIATNVGTSQPPINDTYAGRIAISQAQLPFVDVRDTTGATTDANDIQCGWPTDASVWYELKVETAGSFKIDITGSTGYGTDPIFNPIVIVATGSPGAFQGIYCSSGPAVYFDANQGERYAILVVDSQYDVEGNGGQLTIRVSQDIEVTFTDIGPELGVSYAVEGFLINRNDPKQILLPSLGAGIFKSGNGGRTWRRVYWDSAYLRQDPGNPSIVYGIAGIFVIRSFDFGETWELILADEGCIGCPQDVAIHQASSQIIYVLRNAPAPNWITLKSNSLLKSTDGGNNFEPQYDDGLPQILDPVTGWLIALPQFTNIATSPADPNVFYVVMNNDLYGYYSPGIFKSVDGGRSFSRLEGSPPRPLQVFPHPTDANILFVQDSSYPVSTGIYRSQDGGASFEPVTGGLAPNRINNFVAFDPHNPSHVYVAGQGGFYRSTDGGTTFKPLGLTQDQLGNGATTATVDPGNPNVIYVNTNRGNFKSVTSGITFTSITQGWTASMPTHITFDNEHNPSLYVAAPFGAGILKTQNRGKHYEAFPTPFPLGDASGSPRTIVVAPRDPKTIVTVTRSKGFFTTRDSGRTWTRANVDAHKSRVPAIAIDPVNSNNIYALVDSYVDGPTADGGIPGFYRSLDGGLTFQRTYTDPEGVITHVLAIDPSNPQVIYIAGQKWMIGRGILLKSTDGGLTFAETHLENAWWIQDISVDPTNANNLYLAGGFLDDSYNVRNLMRSSDGGATFTWADAGLDTDNFHDPVAKIFINPQNPARLFAQTYNGYLFVSSDGATSWTRLRNREMDNAAPFRSIAINPKKPNLLYLSGMSVFEVEIK